MLGSPSGLTGDTAGGTCAPRQLLGSFTCTEGNQSTVAPCSWELRVLMERESPRAVPLPGQVGPLLHPGQGTELCMFLMEKH